MGEYGNQPIKEHKADKNMENKRKSQVKWLLNIGVLITVILLAYVVDVFVYRAKAEPPTGVHYTNRNSSHHTVQEQLQVLSKNEELIRLAFEGREEEKEYGTYVIPGLTSTRTLEIAEGGQIASCSSMTPQGITVTEEYVLISAYCKTKKHNSVIYVLNKKNHRFIKTLVLPGRPHAGGLAYDSIHGRIWYSSHDQGIAQAVSIQLEALKKYHFEREQLPIEVEYTYLYGVIRDSFLTFYDNSLYVGYFSGTGAGTLVRYEVNDTGGLVTEEERQLAMDMVMAIPEDSGVIPPCVQGIAFYQGYMLLSQSYGILPSSLSVYKEDKNIYYAEGNELIEYQMPERMEQICVDGDHLYVVFESAAYAYRASSLNIVDRALKLNLKKVLVDLEN
ncbi:MAG: hypothetical protein Q4E89_00885 [Eubacteriales bacterium]|nr:hypothetical protein [Eubacteriales bacterium]